MHLFRKTTLVITLAVLMLFTFELTTLAATVSFPDISDSYAKKDIQFCAGKGIVSGYMDGTFRPKGPATRAEFASMLVRAKDLAQNSDEAAKFVDIPVGTWYSGVVGALVYSQVTSGTSVNKFSPEQHITREQIVVMLMRTMGLEDKAAGLHIESQFGDAAQISVYARDAMGLAEKIGFVNGSLDSKGKRIIKPKDEIDRQALCRLLWEAVFNSDKYVRATQELMGTVQEPEPKALSSTPKAQEAPTGFVVVPPTSPNANDGIISGVTTGMEYRKGSSGNFKVCSGTQITGLDPGVYEIRWAAKPGYNASSAKRVLMPSCDATLRQITINGVAISDYAAYITTYDVKLPWGSGTPTVGAVANDDGAKVTITQPLNNHGTARIVAVAEDGVATSTYTVNFTVSNQASNVAKLSEIRLNGVPLSGFAPDTYTYSVNLPYGSGAPFVEATPKDSKATLKISQATSVNGSANIQVTAQDEKSSMLYSIYFSEQAQVGCTLTGYVFNHSGAWGMFEAVPGARVYLVYEEINYSAVTDARGYYSLYAKVPVNSLQKVYCSSVYGELQETEWVQAVSSKNFDYR